MHHTIHNEYLKVQASEHGAELQSIIHLMSLNEYLWQGYPEHWNRRAPVLFPFVGALKGGYYTYRGNRYEMGQHGFARDQRFELLDKNATKLLFELKSNEETRAVYPFDFALRIGYELVGKKLKTTYSVSNVSGEDLWFSIGGHPAFNCPIDKSSKRSDYHLIFDQSETLDRQLISGGLRTGAILPVLRGERHLPLTDELFERDALIFDAVKSSQISLAKGDQIVWTFHFEGFEFLGIWSKSRQSPFVCIEPWRGVTDHIQHDHDLTKKDGIICLGLYQDLSCAFEVEIH